MRTFGWIIAIIFTFTLPPLGIIGLIILWCTDTKETEET